MRPRRAQPRVCGRPPARSDVAMRVEPPVIWGSPCPGRIPIDVVAVAAVAWGFAVFPLLPAAAAVLGRCGAAREDPPARKHLGHGP